MKETSQDYGKSPYPDSSFRKVQNLQSFRAVSDKPVLPSLTPTKLDIQRNNMISQITPKSEIQSVANRLLQGTNNSNNDTLPSYSQSHSKNLSNYITNHANINTSPFSGHYSRPRQGKSVDSAYTNSSTKNYDSNRGEATKKAVFSGYLPDKPPFHSPQKNNLKESIRTLSCFIT